MVGVWTIARYYSNEEWTVDIFSNDYFTNGKSILL